MVSEALLHLVPGYGLYHAQKTLRSDAPFAVKVRDATMGTTITGLHLIFATEHALKIQAATGSASGGLARNWMMWQRVLPAVASVPTVVVAQAVAATVVQTDLAETFSKTETAKDPWWIAFVSGLTEF
mgnify:CR=1 FL=1